jgi:hypothetical protein
MADSVHKYYCSYCERFTFGETLADLVRGVNFHNTTMHPADFDQWTPETITHSHNYTGSAGKALPQYLRPYGTTSKNEWGDAQNPPNITPQDIALLAEARIKW